MLNKGQKVEVVDQLVERFVRQKIAIFSDIHGVSVTKATKLRRLLRDGDAEYKVAKKTLLDRALAVAGISVKAKGLKGEIGVAFGYGEEATPAKILFKFSKENETFKILGGILSGRVITNQQVVALARLPSREQLLAGLMSGLSSPLRGLVTGLQGNTRNLVVVLNKIKDKKQ